MSLKTKVKAGNITNLSDARYCAGMGVDWLGFPAEIVDPATFKEITDWVTGPEYVLELSETTHDSIGEYPVSLFEISINQLTLIDQLPGMRWIVKLSASEWFAHKDELLTRKDKIDCLVVDSDIHQVTLFSDMATYFQVLINQTDTVSVSDILALPVHGINIAGERELKPGLKDFEKLSSILEELEIMD